MNYSKNVTHNKEIQSRIGSDGLSDYSPKDAPWDKNRSNATDVGGIYAGTTEFKRYAQRISDCSSLLYFG